ncbi:TIM barrel protein [Nocardia sp. XZ_19_385]|uniref:TIM barrel protein n=1 Tax=Nocardia sp. XZ_19_385 TaxID=2769488 RepID=UPI00188EA1DA|nr:TIM barrel protein [Nocardia sp. XZ_19_385]
MAEPFHPLRIAGAPISWGVCEVPGWGHVLDTRTVLSEMAALGLTATELGPPGYLPIDPGELRALLDEFGMRAIGGFLAVPLHYQAELALATVQRTAALYAVAGAEVLVLAAATGLAGYDTRPPLTGREWQTLIDTAARARDIAAEHGLRTVLHPHVGTQIETQAEVEHFLADSDLDLCLDTGHLLIGGTSPVRLARRHPDRIGHIHLKDVRSELADEIRGGKLEYSQAVRQGLYVPLGEGDVDIAALVRGMYETGYRGWYVIEQDTALAPTGAADQPRRDTEQSLRRLAGISTALASSGNLVGK